MNITQLYAALDKKYPLSTALAGDVDGLQLCFDSSAEVRRVLLTLDITKAAAEYAVAGGFDTIVSHHALIRTPLVRITPDCPNASRIIALCGGQINAISLHTRLDAADEGVNAVLASALELAEINPFYIDGYRAGIIGKLKKTMAAVEFAEYLEKKLETRVSFTNSDKDISKIAICGGGGGFCLPKVVSLDVDGFLTGELKHSDVVAYAPLIPLFIAGHHQTETLVLPFLAKAIAEIDNSIYTELFNSGQVHTL